MHTVPILHKIMGGIYVLACVLINALLLILSIIIQVTTLKRTLCAIYWAC